MSDSEEVKKNISRAKIKLFFKQPFFGNLIMGLPLEDSTNSGWCPTAATDGRKIYYNTNFFKTLSVEDIVFVLCHEVLHVAYDHLGRRGMRDAQYWNMSCDYVINDMLITEKIGTMPTKPVEDPAAKKDKNSGTGSQRVGLHDPKYSGWHSEKVYNDLNDRKVEKKLTLDVHLELGNDKKKSNNGSGDDDGNTPGMSRSGSGNADGDGMPSMSQEELEEIRESLRGKILNSAAAAKAAGKLPASLERLVNELTTPVINWRELLSQNIQSCLTDDYTFQRPNRRYMYGGIFLPTLKKDETVDVSIAIDMSGSITDDMAKEFLSEVWGLINSYSDFKLSIVCFDTKCYNFRTFTPDTVDDLLTYKCKGGGGTDFMAFWNYWQTNEIQPKKAIVFTDGYPGGSWGPPTYADTLWIITGDLHSGIVPPFGEWAFFDKNGITERGNS